MGNVFRNNLHGNQPQQLPSPVKSYSPKSIAKHEEIEGELNNNLLDTSKLIFWRITPVVGKAAALASYPTAFFQYVACFTSLIDLFSEKDSISSITKLIKENINEVVAETQFADIKAKIRTIESRLKEIFDDDLTEPMKYSQAAIAVDKCEEILCLFDDRKSILWKMVVISSSILIPFSAICAQVIKFNHEKKCASVPTLNKMKGQLISVLEDYKEQCVHDRLHLITVTTAETCRDSDEIYGSTYRLDNRIFLNPTDMEPRLEWCSYYCVDAWDHWEKRKTTYKSIVKYRQSLVADYQADFDKAMNTVKEQLVALHATNEYTK
ncbi:hypothetical protein I4U23_005615 [Adineta vaga]|nr:hypothetical protein I4U23_005615 [Adineta vaga]